MRIRCILAMSLLFTCLNMLSLTISIPREVCSIDTGDVDQNGQVDLVIGHSSPWENPIPAFTVLYNYQNGSFNEIETSISFSGPQYNIYLIDMNYDSFLDLVCQYTDYTTGIQVPYLRIFYNNNGHFINYMDYQFTGANVYCAYSAGNFNNDDIGDIAYYDAWHCVSILNSNGQYQFHTLEQFQLDYPPQQMRCGDLDNDGRDELIVFGHPSTIFDCTDFGWVQIPVDTTYSHSSGCIGDMNNDGIEEIITQHIPPMGNLFPVRIYQRINNHYEQVYEAQNTFLGWLAVFDYNNDNQSDMLIGHRLETNLGNYQFSESLLSFPGLYAFDNTFADVDGNGYNDIIFIGNNDTGLVTIYFGDGAGNFTADPPNNINHDNTNISPVQISMSAYPNPFTDKVNLKVTGKPISSIINLRIYNIKGELIRVYKNIHPDNVITWDGRDNRNEPVANGIYLCRVSSKYNTNAILKVVKTIK